jgi:hypothetical protein
MGARFALPRRSIVGIVASRASLNLSDGRAESPILDQMLNNSMQITSLRRSTGCEMSEPQIL